MATTYRNFSIRYSTYWSTIDDLKCPARDSFKKRLLFRAYLWQGFASSMYRSIRILYTSYDELTALISKWRRDSSLLQYFFLISPPKASSRNDAGYPAVPSRTTTNLELDLIAFLSSGQSFSSRNVSPLWLPWATAVRPAGVFEKSLAMFSVFTCLPRMNVQAPVYQNSTNIALKRLGSYTLSITTLLIYVFSAT